MEKVHEKEAVRNRAYKEVKRTKRKKGCEFTNPFYPLHLYVWPQRTE